MAKLVLIVLKCCFFVLYFSLPLFVIGQSIQNDITVLLKEQKLAGAVYSIVKNGQISCYSSGLRNMETGDRMHKDDQVHVGSIAKTFLAMGILRLATESRLRLDDPVKKYLKNLPMINPWESVQPVTIRHLLNHTSGLSDIRLWHFFNTEVTAQSPLAEFYKRNPDVLDIHVKPGILFSYSNMGYTLLGMLIEAIVGEPYENYLDRNLLQPMGLNNSTFHFTAQYEHKQLAMGHFDSGGLAFAMPIYVRPAGQFTTTAQDMAIFLELILNGGMLDGKEFIRKEFIDQMGVPDQTIAVKKGLNIGYAFGTLSRDRYGVVGLAHSGNTVGFRAMYYLFPKEKKGFFIAHNMDSETADYDLFNQVIIDHLGLKMPVPAHSRPQKLFIQDPQWDGYYVPVLTRIEPMELIDMISSYTRVSSMKNGLFVKPFQKKGTLLTTQDGALFYVRNRIGASHLFYKDKQGESYLTTGIMTLKKVNGWKIFALTISVLLGILAYAILLFIFLYKVLQKRADHFKSPAAFSSVTFLLFVLSVVIMAMGDVTRIGNKSFPTILLYCSTCLLPLGNFLALSQCLTAPKISLKGFDLCLVVLVAQFLILLWNYGLIPFVIWK